MGGCAWNPSKKVLFTGIIGFGCDIGHRKLAQISKQIDEGNLDQAVTDQGDLSDTERTPRDIREMEAEAVFLLCCESLGLPGAEYSRGYIQSWGQGQTFTEQSAQRIFHAADQILRPGYPGK